MSCVLVLIAALILSAQGAAVVPAQEATPVLGSRLSELGLPELRVLLTDAGVEAPTTAPVGRLLVTLANTTASAWGEALVVRLPAGITEAQAEAELTAANRSGVPASVFAWTIAGGVTAPPGRSGRVVVELEPGPWYLVAGPAPSDQVRPLTITAGAASPPAVEEPQADASVELRDFAVAGLPDGAAPGRQVWRVTNTGSRLHTLELIRSPQPVTVEQMTALLALGPEGTPPPTLGIDPARFERTDHVYILSPGRTIWAEVDLTRPETYVVLCFLPDQATGLPHALLGMVAVFTVR